VAVAPVTFPDHDEGAPGLSPLETGEVRFHLSLAGSPGPIGEMNYIGVPQVRIFGPGITPPLQIASREKPTK
jgi:hypothetical protein